MSRYDPELVLYYKYNRWHLRHEQKKKIDQELLREFNVI